MRGAWSFVVAAAVALTSTGARAGKEGDSLLVRGIGVSLDGGYAFGRGLAGAVEATALYGYFGWAGIVWDGGLAYRFDAQAVRLRTGYGIYAPSDHFLGLDALGPHLGVRLTYPVTTPWRWNEAIGVSLGLEGFAHPSESLPRNVYLFFSAHFEIGLDGAMAALARLTIVYDVSPPLALRRAQPLPSRSHPGSR